MKALKEDIYSNCFFVILLSCITLLPIFIAGCKKENPFGDPNIVALERWEKRNGELLLPEVKERLQIAHEAYENNRLDPVPILIYTALVKAVGIEDTKLFLLIFDEDGDISGFTITEFIITKKVKDSSGSISIIEEQYPALINCPTVVGASNMYIIPIFIREYGQLKDEDLWEKYLSIDLDEQVRQIDDSNLSSWEYTDKEYELWETSLPPIYVSMPEPNKLDVLVQIYDKAGNKSNQVELVDLTNME